MTTTRWRFTGYQSVTLLGLEQCLQCVTIRRHDVSTAVNTSSFKTDLIGNNPEKNTGNRNTLLRSHVLTNIPPR